MTATIVSLCCILGWVSLTLGHSWMSCPRPFNTNHLRGGTTTPPCERFYRGAKTVVKAGDRLKVGWTSNNHAGGYTRLALIEAKNQDPNQLYGATEAEFAANVIKFACYGHDERPGRSKYGDCVHPCNGRPGCEFQNKVGDVERFDTTITVPTNLKDGLYILQTALLVGNSHAPYYSCALLDVKGGNPSMNCKSDSPPPAHTCLKSPAGATLSKLQKGTKRGEFCFLASGRGEVDDRIRETPVNVECDPREHCGLSVNSLKCNEEPGMAFLKTTLGDPKQINCKKPTPAATCDDKIRNQGEKGVDCGGPCPACPSCTDGKQNQGELGVDCGGPCSRSCSTCSDGKQNFGETGIDCGGPCGPCASCTDGKQNQGEYGVDCGGPCCTTCKPTCNDGIMNQGEEAVDCGGPCKKCQPEEAIDYVEVTHTEGDRGDEYFHIILQLKFLKTVNSKWTLRVEYNYNITMMSACGYGQLVKSNVIGDIFTFAHNPWNDLPKKGENHKIYIVAKKKPGAVIKPSGVFFEVHPTDHKPLVPRTKERVTCGSIKCPYGQHCVRVQTFPCKSFPCESLKCSHRMS